MKIAILSNGPGNYSTKRLKEVAIARGHEVTVIKYKECYASIEKNNPTVSYRGEDLGKFDAIIPRIASYMTRYGTAIVRQLEMQGVYTVSSSLAINRSRDKLRSMQLLAKAGVADGTVSLSDGSGMSSYNRVTPRATATLLGWIAKQPWGAEFRATLPIGGSDGTLTRRFVGTALAGKIFAKTGSLNATNALAGYMTSASGKDLTFAIYANDVPEDVPATRFMDRALLAIAAAN